MKAYFMLILYIVPKKERVYSEYMRFSVVCGRNNAAANRELARRGGYEYEIQHNEI